MIHETFKPDAHFEADRPRTEADRTSATGSASVSDVTVVIVGLNAKDFVRGCLDSLRAAEWGAFRYDVVYVDNGSKDGTGEELRANYPWVRLIENGYNAGYCKAANQGARTSSSRYYYFINDDTLVLGDAIARLIEYMDRHSDVATTGSRLLYPDLSEQYSGRRFPNLLSAFMGRRSPLTRVFPNAPWVRKYLCKAELAGRDPFPVDWVSAAGQIVRASDFWAVGGYAEDYYYWHEAVICDRWGRLGKRVMLHPESKVIHYEGKGSGHRPYAAQRFHILDFHRGAFRFYCQQHGLGRVHPGRWLAGLLLGGRAALLLAAAWLRHALVPRSHPKRIV